MAALSALRFGNRALAAVTKCRRRTGLRITSSERLRMHEMAFALEKLGSTARGLGVAAVKAALKVRFFVGSLCKTCACPEHNI
jgi:citrate lyase beta subunit